MPMPALLQWMLLACPAGAGIGPVEALYRADRWRAEGVARGDARMLANGLACAIEARGRVFDPEGKVASLDLAARRAEIAAIDPSIIVPSVPEADFSPRGRVGGAVVLAAANGGARMPLRWTMTFAGGEPATLYLRAVGPVRLRVRDAAGRTRCDVARTLGRALCRWYPARATTVTVEATVTPAARRSFALFTD